MNAKEIASIERQEGRMIAFLWVDRAPRAWNVTIAALLENADVAHIHIGFAPGQSPSAVFKNDPRITIHEGVEFAKLYELIVKDETRMILFGLGPARPPLEAFDRAIRHMSNDPRIGTVSFLSNAAGALSFPHRNTATPYPVEGHDEATLTRSLRDSIKDEYLTPLQLPDGALFIVSADMWEVCGDLDDYGSGSLALALVDLALRGSKRGFNNFLDSSTYVTMPFNDVGAFESILRNPEARHALHQRFPYFPMSYDVEATRPDSVLAQALDFARAKATGLRVLLDGSSLGPKEMGTQVLTLKLCEEISKHADIQALFVAVPDTSRLPSYAQDVLRSPKISVIASDEFHFHSAPQVDVIHRPFQPSEPIPWDRWGNITKRSVITIQDLIAYRNAAYFNDCPEWLNYRDNLLYQVSKTDGIICISHDVVGVIAEERLPIDRSRVFVVENGADGRSGEQPSSVPGAVLQRGWVASPYLFVLGANYAHKNRDLAIRVWMRLRALGYPHKLIMAGASVPKGALQVEESLLKMTASTSDMLVLPDIPSLERNWLLKNASLVLYPTAAEGFGLVPFEAACLGVPTLFVSFGPLRELTEDDNLPAGFRLDGLVDRARAILDDSAVARAAISGAMSNASHLNWANTAKKTVASYFEVLQAPPRRH